jgi:hypothetical protein
MGIFKKKPLTTSIRIYDNADKYVLSVLELNLELTDTGNMVFEWRSNKLVLDIFMTLLISFLVGKQIAVFVVIAFCYKLQIFTLDG